MKKNRFSRREFLQTTAGAAGAALATNAVLLHSEPLNSESLLASAAPMAASDRVRFGIVGVGHPPRLVRLSAVVPGDYRTSRCALAHRQAALIRVK